ncbi:acyl-CoA thioesterase [Lutimaribacter marinistellae]|uniref:Acyl-CoA thioesterase n=1 Tax=Lutimaribacter marinistellae TaxID=1820329 RepID=A0ABV7TMH7_9RHOB
MTDQSLDDVLNAADREGDGLRYPVPAGWTQGRTAYGGFTAALLLHAALDGRDGLPPLRSALVNFTGPVSEPPIVRSEVLRAGRNVTTVNTRAEIDGKVAAQGTFSFGAAQESHVSQGCPAVPSTPPEDTAPFFGEARRAPVAFFNNFETRLIEGALPFSGAERGYNRVWARHKSPAMWDRIEGLLAIADLLPPAVFPMFTRIGPNSSMTWICNILAAQPATRDGWWMVETDLTAAQDGYSSQVMRMWNTDGELVVEGMQSVVVFV